MLDGLTHEQQMLQESTRRFVDEEMLPHEDLVDRDGHVPIELGRQIESAPRKWGYLPPICLNMLVVAVWIITVWRSLNVNLGVLATRFTLGLPVPPNCFSPLKARNRTNIYPHALPVRNATFLR